MIVHANMSFTWIKTACATVWFSDICIMLWILYFKTQSMLFYFIIQEPHNFEGEIFLFTELLGKCMILEEYQMIVVG